jgi:hypothetical protein
MLDVAELKRRFDDFGFEKTRRALSALSLSFFVTLYVMLALVGPVELQLAFLALGACYLVAFLGVAAEWFWGRWFASGLGWSGIMVGVLSLVMIGWSPPLAIYAGLHVLVVLALLGKKMSALYDLQEGWRKRYEMDEYGVARLRKTVTRAAASLPSLILWALGPKQPEGMAGVLLAVGVGGLALAGLTGVLRMRSWGVLALAGAAAALLATGSFQLPEPFFSSCLISERFTITNMTVRSLTPLMGGLAAGVLLLAAAFPFLGPAARFLRRR